MMPGKGGGMTVTGNLKDVMKEKSISGSRPSYRAFRRAVDFWN